MTNCNPERAPDSAYLPVLALNPVPCVAKPRPVSRIRTPDSPCRGLLAGTACLLLLMACEQSPQPSRATAPSPPLAVHSTAARCIVDPLIDPGEVNIPPLRILSAAPAITELCAALGLLDQLVGRTRYCEYPPAVLNILSVGALHDLNVEYLLELQPDLVLVSGASQAITERLRQLELTYESLPDAALADLYTAIQRLGELTGRPRTAAALADALRADLERIARRARTAPPRRVLIVTGTLSEPPTAPFIAAGGSFYDDLLRLAGHQNAISDSKRPFGQIGLEALVAADPDVIIELDPTGRARPAGDSDALRVWSQVRPQLSAVAAGRVHVLTGPRHYLLGPGIAETFAALCERIHPHVDENASENHNPPGGRDSSPRQDHP
jgi:iron complex transport system substrate-binding protein